MRPVNRAKIFLKESVKNPSGKFWASSRVSILQVWIRVHILTMNADSDMLRQRKAPAKSRRKVVRKGSVALLKESTQLGCISQDSYPRKSILREPGRLGSTHAVKFSKGGWHAHKNSVKGKGPSRGIIQKCAPHERSPCAPKFEWKITRGNLAPRKMRSRSSMGREKKCL